MAHLGDLLDAQAGVVASWQLGATDSSYAAAQLRARRWRRVGRCLVTHNGPLTGRQQLWVAVLGAGPGAALYGPSAAAAGGLRGFEPPAVHVVVPHGRHTPRQVGVVLHRRRPPYGVLLQPGAPLPRVAMPAAVIQTAGLREHPRGAAAVLAAAVQQRLVRTDLLRRALLHEQRMRHRQLLVRTIGDLEGGAQALTEIDARRLCARAGLPVPDSQRVRRDRDGRRRYLDLEWAPWRLVAEIDGRQHMEVLQWTDDLHRMNEIVIPGDRTVLRFTSITVRTRADRFVGQLGRALVARGWTPGAHAA